MSRRYVVLAGDIEHEIPPAHVIPWLRGFLAHLEITHPQAASLVDVDQITIRPSENFDESCYRVLTICHDQHIIVYRGIREKP
jgi:hypothetical protein